MKCICCKAKNPKGSKYCIKCGAELFINLCTNDECKNGIPDGAPTDALFCPLCGKETIFGVMVQQKLAEDIQDQDTNMAIEDADPNLVAAVDAVVNAQTASTTALQKKLKIGYAYASRLVDLLEKYGIIGPAEGAQPRKILLASYEWEDYKRKNQIDV